MKQKELANQLGISKSYLSMILSGKRRCPPELEGKLSSQKVVNFEANLSFARRKSGVRVPSAPLKGTKPRTLFKIRSDSSLSGRVFSMTFI